MANRKVIRLNEQALRNVVSEAVRRIIRESWFDSYVEEEDPMTGKEDFENSNFEEKLMEKYPDKKFEIYVDNDGTVSVIDITDPENQRDYVGYGEVVYDNEALRRPDPRNPYREAEGRVGHYEYDECFRDIVAQIEADAHENSLNFAEKKRKSDI